MWEKSKVAKGTNDDFDLQSGEFWEKKHPQPTPPIEVWLVKEKYTTPYNLQHIYICINSFDPLYIPVR